MNPVDPVRVMIFGSCVSRDSFEYFDDTDFNLASYTARQSLISSFSPSATFVSADNITGLTSNFQRNMLLGDLSSSLPQTIREHADSVGLLLLDLIDERSGVILGNKNEYITNSLAFQNSGLADSLEDESRFIAFGSDEHYDLWTKAFDNFNFLLKDQSLIRRTVLLDSNWALETIEGDVFPLEGSRMDPAVINQRYKRYYNYAADNSELFILKIPSDLCVGTRSHKWGPAPFHYSPQFYRYVRSSIKNFLDTEQGKHE